MFFRELIVGGHERTIINGTLKCNNSNIVKANLKLIQYQIILSNILLDKKSFINNHDFQLKFDGYINEGAIDLEIDYDCGNNDVGSIEIEFDNIAKTIDFDKFRKIKTIVLDEPIVVGGFDNKTLNK